MFLALSLLLSLSLDQGFRAKLTVEEGDDVSVYGVDFQEGLLRIEPEGEAGLLIVDVASKTVTLILPEERVYCRTDKEGFQRLTDWGMVHSSWAPWAYEVEEDLVENLELRQRGSSRLPSGQRGLLVQAFSERYDRVLAEYWLDPRVSGELFFQWRKIYFDFWNEDDEPANKAQEARLSIYDRLNGLPFRMEERYRLLTRPRVIVLEERQPLPPDAFQIPEEFSEKSVGQLLWQDLLRRFERWFRPSPVPKKPRQRPSN